MTDLKKIESLGYNDLVEVCEKRKIKVSDTDDAESLRKKLTTKVKK